VGELSRRPPFDPEIVLKRPDVRDGEDHDAALGGLLDRGRRLRGDVLGGYQRPVTRGALAWASVLA